MELYILDNNDLSTLSILECSDYEINLDNQFTDKSTFRVNKAPGQIKDNFLVDEVEATDKEEKFVNLVCSDISNIFNRKIIEQDTNLMTTRSIEYFLAHMMDVNFVNSDDSVLNKSYINITYTEHTQAKVQTNAENGIYNFHTFMENCREYQNVYVDFSIENGYLNIEIKYKNDTPVTIDTTIPEITHYNKVYEQDITAKVTVYVRETNETLNWYLKTDRTVTTNKNDPNRATGAIEVISVDTLDVAEQEALNVFKGNTYKHLVEFSMSKNSKLVDTTTLYIGRAIIIKTPDGIYESIISGISLHDDNFVNFKSGNIRITFIDKLKQEQENYGNKLDVTGGTIKGNLTTTGTTTTGTLISNGNANVNGDLEMKGAVIRNLSESGSTIPETTILDVAGSTDGFQIKYKADTADIGVAKLTTQDDNNAQLTLGNTISGTYNEALRITNGQIDVFNQKNLTVGCNGNNTNNYPWHRIATVTAGTGSWQDRDAILEIKSNFDATYYGLIKVSLRTNSASSSQACSGAVRWLVRSGYAAGDVVMGRWGVSGQNVYADVYLKVPASYPRTLIRQYDPVKSWNLISSQEASDTTTTDKKGSVECYKDVATAATQLRGQAYTATHAGVDVATVNYSNSAGSATSATTWSGNTALTNDHATLNTGDTWIPVISSGKLQHTLRAIWSTQQHTNYNTNQHYLATLSTLTYWNGAYNSSGNSNLQYATKGKIPRMRSSAQIVYKRQSYSSSAWGNTNLVANSSKTVGSDFVISGNTIKVNNSNVNRVKVTLSISGARAGTGTDLYFNVIANGTQTDVYYKSYNSSYGYWASGGSMTFIADVSNGSTIYARGGTGSATTFEPLNTILVVEDVSVW